MKVKTFDALWDQYKLRRVKGKKSERETIRLYETYVQPVIGSKTVSRMKFQTIDNMHEAMKDTPYQANRVLSLMRPLFSYAQALGWVPPEHNPAKLVRLFPERKRRRHMKASEAPLISTAIRRRELTSPHACVFLWLIIFTGARSGEIKKAKWSDLTGNRIVLKTHKADQGGAERIIVLPPIALEKLKLIERGHPDERIITIANPEYIWRKIRVEGKCRDLRIHDLRHTFATYALEKGYSLDQIGESLGHANPATTKIYAEMTTRSRQRVALDASLAILDDMDVRDVPTNPLE